jgi:hypothetical protein
LHVDAEVSLVPSLHRLRVFGFEEDATNTSNAFHVYLARKDEEVRVDLFSFFIHGRLNDP